MPGVVDISVFDIKLYDVIMQGLGWQGLGYSDLLVALFPVEVQPKGLAVRHEEGTEAWNVKP